MIDQCARTGEFDIIARYFAPLSQGFPGAQNLTNDTANFSIADGNEAVVTLDTMVAGVHFMPDDPPDLIARKLLRVNLSDLASSGARPVTYFLSLCLPSSIGEDWIARFARGLAVDQKAFGIGLGGGDTTSTPGPLTLSITAMGECPRGQVVSRAGALRDQDIYVSGTIGDAALALALIQSDGMEKALGDVPGLVSRYRVPEPRVVLGQSLRNLATAAIDVSDGLVADLSHICETSSVGAEIKAALLPLSAEAQILLSKRPELLEQVLSGGDDYELLFTVRPEDAEDVRVLSATLNVAVTCIGRTNASDKAVILSKTGEMIDLASTGWRHF